MSLSDVAIKRPVFTSMMALCLIVLGIMGVNRIGTDLFPDVTFPVVMVTTVYKGAGPGVSEIQVDLDLDKVKAVGTSPFEIAQRIGFENLNLPAGHLSLGPTELTVRTLGEFKDIDAIRALPVAQSKTGSQVRLDEVAAVKDGVTEHRTIARLNGKDAIILEAVEQPGSNTVQVAANVKEGLAVVGAPRGAHISAQ